VTVKSLIFDGIASGPMGGSRGIRPSSGIVFFHAVTGGGNSSQKFLILIGFGLRIEILGWVLSVFATLRPRAK